MIWRESKICELMERDETDDVNIKVIHLSYPKDITILISGSFCATKIWGGLSKITSVFALLKYSV